MPRGNDATTALQDLYSQYGPHANASELIRAQEASTDPALTQIGLIAVDYEATDELKGESGWADSVSSKLSLPDDATVMDAAVRGNGLVVTYFDEAGVPHKAVGAANDDYKPPTLTPEQQAIRARAQADTEVNVEVANLRAQAAAKLQAAQADIEKATAEAIGQIREKAEQQVQEVQQEAQKDAESDTGDTGDSQPAAEPAADAPTATPAATRRSSPPKS